MSFFGFIILAYLLGSIPFYLWAEKLAGGGKIWSKISHGIPGKNKTHLILDPWIALIIYSLDFFKSYLVINLALSEFNSYQLIFFAALVVVAGHFYSPYLKFKSRFGLLVIAGTISAFSWSSLVIWLAVYVLSNFFLRKETLSALIALVCLPLILFLTTGEQYLAMIALAILALAVVKNSSYVKENLL